MKIRHMFLGWCIFFILVLNLFTAAPTAIEKIGLENFGIYQPTLMKVKDGDVFIWDKKNTQFYKIKNRAVVKTFGRKGLGPGEFQEIVSFTIIDKTIYCYDVSLRMIKYDIDGKYIGEDKVNLNGRYLTLMEKINDNAFLSGEMLFLKEGKITRTLFFNSGEKKIKLASSFLSIKKKLSLDNLTTSSWSIGKNYCYLLPSHNSYRVDVFDLKGQRFLKTIEKKGYQKQRYSQKEIDEKKGKIKKIRNSTAGFPDINIEIPEFKPAVKNIDSDDDDNLFIVTYTGSEKKNLVEVYDKKARYLNQFSVKAHKILKVEKDNIYLIIENEDFFLEIYRFR